MVRGVAALVFLVGCAAPATSLDAYVAADSAVPSPDAWSAVDAGSDAWRAPVDGGTDAPPACELVPQSGCATGEACRVGTTVVSCGAVTNNPGEYTPCSSTTACAAGMQCLGGDTHTTCRRFCRDGVTDCGTGRACIHPSFMLVDANDAFVALPAGIGICGSP